MSAGFTSPRGSHDRPNHHIHSHRPHGSERPRRLFGNDGGGTSSTDSEAQDAISEMDSGADSTIDAEPMPAPSLSVDKRALTLVGAAGAAVSPAS